MTQQERAILRAMHLLTARDYTEKQLHDKLAKSEYTEEDIAEALNYVKSFHYVDDARYTDSYLEYYKDSRSYRRMEQDLLRRGIKADLIRECWKRKIEQGCDYDERHLIEELLRKKHFSLQEADYKEKQRMAAYLYRKGFEVDAIQKYMLLDIS